MKMVSDVFPVARSPQYDTKKTKDRQQEILPEGYHTQPTGHEIIQCK